MRLQLLGKIFLAFFVFLVVVHFYVGATTIPNEGDSLAYHLPIAKAILDGRIVDPSKFQASPFLKYSPGSSELILALLIFFKLPVNIYNVLGIIFLFFACQFTGKRVGLLRDLAIIFAVSVCSLNGIVRWMNTQVIDIWLMGFFIFGVGLVLKPEKNKRYFLCLGFVLGMLFGSKFTGPVFCLILFIFFIKNLYGFINLKRLILFLVPFLIFGTGWYLRNYLLTGNPIYPQPFLGFRGGGGEFSILTTQVWKVFTTYPKGFFMTINAYISELTIWTLAIFVPVVIFLYLKIKRRNFNHMVVKKVVKLFLLGICVLGVYMFLPSALQEHIAVSVFRYSYSAFVLFMLCVFVIAQEYKKEILLSLISLFNIFILGFPLSYHPKLVFLYIPITLLIIYFGEIKKYLSVKL